MEDKVLGKKDRHVVIATNLFSSHPTSYTTPILQDLRLQHRYYRLTEMIDVKVWLGESGPRLNSPVSQSSGHLGVFSPMFPIALHTIQLKMSKQEELPSQT